MSVENVSKTPPHGMYIIRQQKINQPTKKTWRNNKLTYTDFIG